MLFEAGLCPYCCTPLANVNGPTGGGGQEQVDRDLHHLGGQ